MLQVDRSVTHLYFENYPHNSAMSPEWYSSQNLKELERKELDTHARSSLKFSHPSLLPWPTMSLVFRNWVSDRTDSTAGARASLVTMHLAFEVWSRYKMSLAVSWVVPGKRTIPGKKQEAIEKTQHFPKWLDYVSLLMLILSIMDVYQFKSRAFIIQYYYNSIILNY